MEIVHRKNLELQQQGSKLPVTGDLYTALNSTKIIVASVEDIREVLRLVMIKIGLRAANWPTDEEKLVLIEHIVRHYAGHTCEEIKLAFDMAIAGKLEVEVNCYENFSCLYFSNIMNAYRLWSKGEFKQIPEVKQLPGSSEPPMPDEDFLLTVKNTFHFTKRWQLISVLAYDILVKQGKINLTNAEKEVIKQKATTNFFSLDNKENTIGLSYNQKERFIIQDAKKIAVAEYFNNENP